MYIPDGANTGCPYVCGRDPTGGAEKKEEKKREMKLVPYRLDKIRGLSPKQKQTK